jgi:hypothetical protein
MPDAKEILDQLNTLNVKMDLLAAHDDEDDEDAARKDDEAASADEAEAARAEAEAKRARDDADEEAASAHEQTAAGKHTSAFMKRMAAASRYEALAARKREASDEDAAKAHEAAAAKCKADAKKHEEAAAALKAKKHEEEAAAAKKKPMSDDDEDDPVKLFGMFMRAMRYANDEDAMTYPAAVRGKKRSHDASAEHPDEDEDTALIRRLLKQDRGEQQASRVVGVDLATKRQLREMRASLELLTDTVSKMSGLLTDVVERNRGLATDQNRDKNGGPVRKTMQATGERFVGKFDDAKVDDGKQTEDEIYAAAKAKGLDERAATALIVQASFEGKLKQ